MFTDRSYGKNFIIVGGGLSSSVHVNNEGKDILIVGEGPTQFDFTTLKAEAKYPVNFTQLWERFKLSLTAMEAEFFYLLMLQKYISLK